MKISELRGHLRLRIAHELSQSFFVELMNYLEELHDENDVHLQFIHQFVELRKQKQNRDEIDLLMEAFLRAAKKNGLAHQARSTKPKGYTYAEASTDSCVFQCDRIKSKGASNAIYRLIAANANRIFLSNRQPDLLTSLIPDSNQPINFSDRFFILVSYFRCEQTGHNISFQLPTPDCKIQILTFTLQELIEASIEPMTKISREPMIVLRKRFNEIEDDDASSGL